MAYKLKRAFSQRSSLKNRIKTILKNRRGITLVELVVTFALLGLFATSTCLMLSSAIKVYHQIRGLNNAIQVSDTLLDKITGVFEGAQVGSAKGNIIKDTRTLKIAADGTYVDLYDRTGSHIVITTTDHGGVIPERPALADTLKNQLLIYYYPVKTSKADLSGNEINDTFYEGVDWRYDTSAYMGFSVKSLTFTWVGQDGGEYPKNVFKVDLTLVSDRDGEFESTRYVECYNFSSAEAAANISIVNSLNK